MPGTRTRRRATCLAALLLATGCHRGMPRRIAPARPPGGYFAARPSYEPPAGNTFRIGGYAGHNYDNRRTRPSPFAARDSPPPAFGD